MYYKYIKYPNRTKYCLKKTEWDLQVLEIRPVKNSVGDRIRKIRAAKGLSQANVAEDLGITAGAFAKIERGETDAPLSRLQQIAKSLEVNVSDFFEESISLKDNKTNYGFATKEEVEHIVSKMMQSVLKEIDKLRAEIHKPASNRKIRKK
jgi:transcriptional regulator with XRE-family HTH domain